MSPALRAPLIQVAGFPRLAEPRLGLRYNRCFAAGCVIISMIRSTASEVANSSKDIATTNNLSRELSLY